MNVLNFPKNKVEKFWSKVQIPKDYEKDCWIWTGYKDKDGYGIFSRGINNKNIRANRYSYMYYNGMITPKLKICHTCDNPACVNPNHLWEGTTKQNSDDMVKKGRAPKGGQAGKGTEHIWSILTDDIVYNMLCDIENDKFSNIFEVGKSLNVAPTTIRSIFNKSNWQHITNKFDENRLTVIKSKIIKTYLTDADAIDIKTRILNGESNKYIAKIYNVTPDTIGNIKRGKTKKYITL